MAKLDTRKPAGCLGPRTGAFLECLLCELFLLISMNICIVWMQVVLGGVDGEELAKRKFEVGEGDGFTRCTKCTMLNITAGLFNKSSVFAGGFVVDCFRLQTCMFALRQRPQTKYRVLCRLAIRNYSFGSRETGLKPIKFRIYFPHSCTRCRHRLKYTATFLLAWLKDFLYLIQPSCM